MISGRRIACRLVVVSLVLVAAGGCTTTTISPAMRTPLRAGQGAQWGPLAVVDEPVTAGAAAGVGPGTLHIGTDCVTLRVGAGERTLVWRGPGVAWDSRAHEIVFTDPREGQMRLSNGERIFLGGATFTNPHPIWLATPMAACPAGPMFTVHSVTRGGPGETETVAPGPNP